MNGVVVYTLESGTQVDSRVRHVCVDDTTLGLCVLLYRSY